MMFVSYGNIGVYVLSLNPKERLNRIFFLGCLSLGMWAFAFIFANVATHYEQALFWRKLASFGWGVHFSFQLHFFLLLSNRYELLTYRRTYLFLYLPAIVTITIFGLYSPIANSMYHLVQLDSGWINVSEGGFWDSFYNTYYILFSLLGLVAIWSWKGLSKDVNKKKTAIIISTTLFLAIVAGSVTDIFLNQSLELYTPQMGIVFAIIPISSFYYSIKKHGFMTEPDMKHSDKMEILNFESRRKFFEYISIAIICGSVANIGHYFYYGIEIQTVLQMSIALFAFGLMIRMISFLSISHSIKDLMLFLALSCVIILVFWRFSYDYGNNIVWPIPVIFLLLTAVFRQNKFFFLILLVTLIVHFWAWLSVPEIIVTVNNLDYLTHIIIYALISALVYSISRIYTHRLYEQEKNTSLQRIISEISSEFVSVNLHNFESKIDEMLKKSGEYYGVDRAYVFRYSQDLSTLDYTNEWCQEGITPAIDMIGSLPTASFPWWMTELEQNGKIHIEDITKLPEDASAERDLLLLQEVKSLISVPIFNHRRLIGFLGFDAVQNKKSWSVEHQEALQVMANIVSDAIVKVEAEKEINYMAYFDALTGLSNRTYFNMQLEKMIELSKRKEKLLGILFLDLDEFKSINDTMGHEMGDKLLVTIGERLSKVVRKSDVVCRFGGDEFLVMLPQMDDVSQIEIATEKVMGVFQEAITIKDQNLHMTASCGVAVQPLDGQDTVSLIKSADLAMYESKKAGKNRFSFCTPIMKEAVKEKMQLTNDLYRALERDELTLYYQPQMSIESGNIIGLEALIRWNHPTRGLVLPGQFIPLAEETGLIHKIGAWVLKTACLQNKAWQAKGYSQVVMAVNLSVEQFRDSRLVGIVSEVLAESGLEPRYLELEITEGIAIKEPSYIIGLLHQLKALGVSISIDDFGTEYSSLSRLKELPIDRLKMAMEFVQGIDKGTKDEAIALVIINLAKSLGLKVIAEGVEEEGQFTFLKDRVCDEVQGYYFYRPMPADEIERIITV